MKNGVSKGYKKTATHFVLNVQRAMRVAGNIDGEHPAKMTQETLSKRAGIARSTISNHKELSNSEEKSPNPTLEKICAIAESLNVPPAFLLLRSEDWVKLAQVVDYYSTLSKAKHANPILEQIANCGNIAPIEQAELGLKLAKTLEITNLTSKEVFESLSPEDADIILSKTQHQKQCIFAASALPPINYMNTDERLAAFVFSVIFGASYRAN